eukprot:scaffold13277_cov114-Isochrysis_galbana.AAC.8
MASPGDDEPKRVQRAAGRTAARGWAGGDKKAGEGTTGERARGEPATPCVRLPKYGAASGSRASPVRCMASPQQDAQCSGMPRPSTLEKDRTLAVLCWSGVNSSWTVPHSGCGGGSLPAPRATPPRLIWRPRPA